MIGPIASIAIMALGGTLLYKGAEMEHRAGWPWVVLSVGLWALAFFWLGWGVLAQLGIQVALFIALGVAICLGRKKPEIIR